MPYLQGQTNESPHNTLYCRFGKQHAVRQGDYKLLQLAEGPSRLYDLRADVSEQNDLASARPKIVTRLVAAYDAWNPELIDPLWKRGKMAGKPHPAAAGGE